MENPKLCECPFTKWCHESRQFIQLWSRQVSDNKSIEQCDFYQMIKEKENEDAN